jgi:hypothetical protein
VEDIQAANGLSRLQLCDGQTSPHRPRLVVPRSICPPLCPSPHETRKSFRIGTAVINNNIDCRTRQRLWTRRTIYTSHADAGLLTSKNTPAHHAMRGNRSDLSTQAEARCIL